MVESLPFLLKGGVCDPGAGPSELAIEALSKPSTKKQTKKAKVTEGWKAKWQLTDKALRYQTAEGCGAVPIFLFQKAVNRHFITPVVRSQSSPQLTPCFVSAQHPHQSQPEQAAHNTPPPCARFSGSSSLLKNSFQHMFV